MIAIALISCANINSIAHITEGQSEYIQLMPPIGQILQMEKKQIHRIGDAMITRTSVHHIIFSKSNDNIIGFDITMELKSETIDGHNEIVNILSRSFEKVGSVRHFTYDQVNDVLTLNNSDELWDDFLHNVSQVQNNAGQSIAKEKAQDQRLIEQVKNIPPESRNSILSEDMQTILGFVGKNIAELDHHIQDKDIIINKRNDLQGGKIMEENRYHLSTDSGLVHIFDRKLTPATGNKHIITTSYIISPVKE